MDRKRKAVFLRLFENSRKRRKAADEEIDRMIESLEDSADDEYQEEDEEKACDIFWKRSRQSNEIWLLCSGLYEINNTRISPMNQRTKDDA